MGYVKKDYSNESVADLVAAASPLLATVSQLAGMFRRDLPLPPRPALALDQAEEFIERLQAMPRGELLEAIERDPGLLREFFLPRAELADPPYVGPNPDDLAVWWLDDAAIEIVLDGNWDMPGYAREQVRSMDGRPLRGRLWAAEPALDVTIDGRLFDETGLGRALGRMGGVVMYRADVARLVGMPGILTDLELRRIRVSDDGG